MKEHTAVEYQSNCRVPQSMLLVYRFGRKTLNSNQNKAGWNYLEIQIAESDLRLESESERS